MESTNRMDELQDKLTSKRKTVFETDWRTRVAHGYTSVPAKHVDRGISSDSDVQSTVPQKHRAQKKLGSLDKKTAIKKDPATLMSNLETR